MFAWQLSPIATALCVRNLFRAMFRIAPEAFADVLLATFHGGWVGSGDNHEPVWKLVEDVKVATGE